jgi:hypothetical protein
MGHIQFKERAVPLPLPARTAREGVGSVLGTSRLKSDRNKKIKTQNIIENGDKI